MLKNSSVYFVLWILLQLLVEINCQIAPLRRFDHTATLIDSKLYILSGDSLTSKISATAGKEFFYLDVSVPFNTQNLLWQDLSSDNTVPPHYDATSIKGGANNNTLVLYGGSPYSNNVMTSLVYTFDPRSNSWTIPEITGIRKNELMGITDNNGKMYLWGGVETTNGEIVNDMLILDTVKLSWGKGSSIGAPTPRSNYGAVLLPDRKIIYMGGHNITSVASALNEVYLYDIDEDSWSTRPTSGNVPFNRFGFSIVLGLDGQKIIMFAGSSLYVLDISTLNWYIPNVSGKIPSTRFYHKANVIGKYMVISFGASYDPSESDILLLDISNNDEYIWTNNFEPSPPSSSQSPTSSSLPSSIIGTAIGSICGVLLGVGGSFLYRWNKNKQKRKIAASTPGNEEGNSCNHENLVIPKRIINNQGNQGQEKIPSNSSPIDEQEILQVSDHGQEKIPTDLPPINSENKSNREPIGDNHGQGKIPTDLPPINSENKFNREPIGDNHGQGKIPTDLPPISTENKSNREPIDDNHGQGKIPTDLPSINSENKFNREPIGDNHGQEKIPTDLPPISSENKSNREPIDDNVYNHGQETIPIANNGKPPLDDDVLQQLKNEMLQTLRQEIMQNLGQQNNGQASNK